MALIQAALAEARATIAAAHRGESSRAAVSDAVRQTFEVAQPLLDKVIARLKENYFDNLANGAVGAGL